MHHPCFHLYCRNLIFLLIQLPGVFSLFSCNEKIPSPYFSDGAIIARVHYFQYNDSFTYDSVTITVHGPYGKKSGTTDVDGWCKISGLGNGTYEVTMEKERYGKHRFFGVQISGTDTIWINCELYWSFENFKPPRLLFQFDDATAQMFGLTYCVAINSDLKANATTKIPAMNFYIGKNEDVSYKNYKWQVHANPFYSNGVSNVIYLFDYSLVGLTSGEKYFIKGYPVNFYGEYDYYWDPYQGAFVYPTMNYKEGSNTLTIMVP